MRSRADDPIEARHAAVEHLGLETTAIDYGLQEAHHCANLVRRRLEKNAAQVQAHPEPYEVETQEQLVLRKGEA